MYLRPYVCTSASSLHPWVDIVIVLVVLLPQALANLINSTYADIINSHVALGVLTNGTFNGSITINGDSDLVSMQPLLDHIVAITGV